MDVHVGDILVMKKNHPCGGNRFSLHRVGMDFRIRCEKCGHEMMLARSKVEKSIKKVERDGVLLDKKALERKPAAADVPHGGI